MYTTTTYDTKMGYSVVTTKNVKSAPEKLVHSASIVGVHARLVMPDKHWVHR